MGVFGAGNSGAAVNKFVPGDRRRVRLDGGAACRAAIMLGTLVLFWMFSASDLAHLVPSHVKFGDQLKMLKDPSVLKYCQYYSIVFGGYVALSLWMVQYYVGESTADIRAAALLAARFSLPAACCARSAAGCRTSMLHHHLVGDVGELDLPVPAAYPQTDFTITTVDGTDDLSSASNVYMFTILMFALGIAFALRQGERVRVHPTTSRTTSASQRHRRPRRGGMGGIPADHVRRADGPDRHPPSAFM